MVELEKRGHPTIAVTSNRFSGDGEEQLELSEMKELFPNWKSAPKYRA
jgi:hypothetical protein